jgi:pantetheine-phosphate adenylyltransferase
MSSPSDHQLAVYTGVFDPVHLGHVDIIERGRTLFDRLVVGVGINPEKESLFSLEDRVRFLKLVVRKFDNVEVRPFKGLTVRFVREVGARIMLRGLRTLSDMEYEFTMSLTNSSLDPGLETVFLLAKDQFSHVSSTLIRQIFTLQGDLEKFVPPEVKTVLAERLKNLPED